ncbi:unnamed protein product [Pieris brassicae]|uniref:Homeobox domain-containing protein n=1 Tax=Pieris brassicae TaxID=7116 RepID=A0A9P0XC24_PIEBR|nr:unnamed protein product [Pieris brassicae]
MVHCTSSVQHNAVPSVRIAVFAVPGAMRSIFFELAAPECPRRKYSEFFNPVPSMSTYRQLHEAIDKNNDTAHHYSPKLRPSLWRTLCVKIWFQNRRSKYKKMMKAAQVGAPPPNLGLPPGSPPNNNQLLHGGGGSSSGSQHSPSAYQSGPTQAHSPTPSSTPVSELSPGLSPTGTPWDVKQPPQQSWDVKVGYPNSGRSPDGSCDVKPHQQSWDPRVGYGAPGGPWDMKGAHAHALHHQAAPQPHPPYVPQYSWYQPEANPGLLTENGLALFHRMGLRSQFLGPNEQSYDS